MTCPGCDGPSPTVNLRYGSGASMVEVPAELWCASCIQRKCVEARAVALRDRILADNKREAERRERVMAEWIGDAEDVEATA